MKGKRFGQIFCASSLIAITISATLALWTARAEAYAHYRPEYKQIDLRPMLQKDELTEEDYSLLFRQTGLARAGIDELRAAGRQEELLYLQQRYFADPEIECLHYNLLIRSERLVTDKGEGGASEHIDMPVGAAPSAREPDSYSTFPYGNLEPIASLILTSGELGRDAAFLVNKPEWNAVLRFNGLEEEATFSAKVQKHNNPSGLGTKTAFPSNSPERRAEIASPSNSPERRAEIASPSNSPEPSTEIASPSNCSEPSVVSPAGSSAPCKPFPTVQPGDILITFSGHVFGWRSGHAAIVIDAERQLTLEAITMGCDSRICSLADWEAYPSVALLRLKGASLQERERIAAFAKEHLQGLPYSLAAFATFDDGTDEMPSGAASFFSGALGQAVRYCIHLGTIGIKRQRAGHDMFDGIMEQSTEQTTEQATEQAAICGKDQEPLAGTQCAHLVWYAYRNFGYDLDSDGGFVVTPDDLYHSDLLELVQIYGISPNY